MRLLTIGHGAQSRDAFTDLVRGAGGDEVVDIRRHPGSRRHPHFSRDSMAGWLAEAGVGYRWDERLGGRRSVAPGSPHTALQNDAFRGYAGHMATSEFAAAVDALLAEAGSHCVAVMCAESLWWRCHRRLLADALVLLHGTDVDHVLPDGRVATHRPTAGVRVAGETLVYDVDETPTLL